MSCCCWQTARHSIRQEVRQISVLLITLTARLSLVRRKALRQQDEPHWPKSTIMKYEGVSVSQYTAQTCIHWEPWSPLFWWTTENTDPQDNTSPFWKTIRIPQSFSKMIILSSDGLLQPMFESYPPNCTDSMNKINTQLVVQVVITLWYVCVRRKQNVIG